MFGVIGINFNSAPLAVRDKISFTDSSAFSDASEISEYAKDAVSKLAAKKIINGMGNGTFSPKATLTRAQAAVLIYSALCALQ